MYEILNIHEEAQIQVELSVLAVGATYLLLLAKLATGIPSLVQQRQQILFMGLPA
jgi:hypothetical protein